MTIDLIYKIIIIVVFVLILVSLVSSFTFMIKDQGKTERVVKSLTVRVVLSVSLFFLLIFGYLTGMIKPHGLMPPVQVENPQP